MGRETRTVLALYLCLGAAWASPLLDGGMEEVPLPVRRALLQGPLQQNGACSW